MLTRQLGGRDRQQPLGAEAASTNSPSPSSSKLRVVLIEQVAVGAQPAEEVDLVQQRRVLDDQRVGRGDRLAHPDRPVVDAAERDHRRARALRAEARERLRVPALDECRHRQQLGGGDHALPAAAVDADLKHA